jgi:SAM-dependent methyltransferase
VEGEADSAALHEVWRQFFSQLPTGANILDLATGNGFVPHVAAKASRDQSLILNITGIDAAEISPLGVPKAKFVSKVRMEALPFDDLSFDVVASQFGFEYGARATCASEAARVLKLGGRLCLVLHARNGAVHEAISAQVARLEVVLRQDGLMQTLMTAADAETEAARRVDQMLAACWERSAPALAGAPDEDAAAFYANGITNLWRARHRYAPTDLQRSIDDAQRRAEGILVRHRALLKAACSRDDVGQISSFFQSAGVRMRDPAPIMDGDGRQIAWLLGGSKRNT